MTTNQKILTWAPRVLSIAFVLFLSLFAASSLYTLPLALLEPLRRKTWLLWAARGVGALVCLYLVVGAGLILLDRTSFAGGAG